MPVQPSVRYPLVTSAAAGSCGKFGTRDLGVGKEGSLELAERWGELGAQGAINPSFTGGGLITAWSTGDLAYWITGPWNIPVVLESGVNLEVEPVPGWEGVDTPGVAIVCSQGFCPQPALGDREHRSGLPGRDHEHRVMNAIREAAPRPPAWILAVGEGGYRNRYSNNRIVTEELGLAQVRILDGADPTASIEEAAADIEARTGEGS